MAKTHEPIGGAVLGGEALQLPPIYVRMRAQVPRVLYLNFLARQAYAEGLAPDCFRPVPLPSDPAKTLFTILLFELRGGRPAWAPDALARLAPTVRQSNWRFYGTLTTLPEGELPGVFFWRTVTDSRWLTAFGLHIARCFPLHRARRVELLRRGEEVQARVELAVGSAPELVFRGRLVRDGDVPPPFRGVFSRFRDYARWIADQHLSLVAWEREIVVQDMHLTLGEVPFVGVEAEAVTIPALSGFVEDPATPVSCFWGENLEVWLDSIRALPRNRSDPERAI